MRIGSGADFALFGGGGRFDGGMPSSPRAYNTNKTGSNQKGWAETGAAGDYLTPVKRINIFVEELAEQKIALVEKIINNDILMAIYHVGMATYKIVKAAASFATGNYVGAAMAGASAAWHTWKAIDRLCCALELK